MVRSLACSALYNDCLSDSVFPQSQRGTVPRYTRNFAGEIVETKMIVLRNCLTGRSHEKTVQTKVTACVSATVERYAFGLVSAFWSYGTDGSIH